MHDTTSHKPSSNRAALHADATRRCGATRYAGEIFTHHAHLHPILGTDLHLTVDVRGTIGTRRQRAVQTERAVVGEIGRLEQIFSAFQEHSTFRRWQQGEASAHDVPELAWVLQHAAMWISRSNGTCNPFVGSVGRRWTASAASNTEPAAGDLDALVNELAEYTAQVHMVASSGTDLDTVFPQPMREHLTLHATAKGFIVDCAAQIGLHAAGADSITVNIGGDLVRRGASPTPVAIQNPRQPYDNADPLAVLRIENAAVATSGSSERGWRIRGKWFSHVIDPRTAHPVEHVRSATVVACSALQADTIATAFSVLHPEERAPFAESLTADEELTKVAFCIVDNDGHTVTNTTWDNLAEG